MGSLRLRLRPATWLALIAVLALALAPTVSRALAFAHGEAAWAEVCTPLGLKLQAVADAGEEAPAAHLGQLEHCGFCGLSTGAAPLPVTASADLPSATAAEALPALFLQAPRTLFAWLSALPRAPPFHS
ncbi:MAG: DUF2946 domain-containing protein [Rubrivivax sp.]|nr:DUF2946 domain-containing protein [Rubrivivax sp.]